MANVEETYLRQESRETIKDLYLDESGRCAFHFLFFIHLLGENKRAFIAIIHPSGC